MRIFFSLSSSLLLTAWRTFISPKWCKCPDYNPLFPMQTVYFSNLASQPMNTLKLGFSFAYPSSQIKRISKFEGFFFFLRQAQESQHQDLWKFLFWHYSNYRSESSARLPGQMWPRHPGYDANDKWVTDKKKWRGRQTEEQVNIMLSWSHLRNIINLLLTWHHHSLCSGQ